MHEAKLLFQIVYVLPLLFLLVLLSPSSSSLTQVKTTDLLVWCLNQRNAIRCRSNFFFCVCVFCAWVVLLPRCETKTNKWQAIHFTSTRRKTLFCWIVKQSVFNLLHLSHLSRINEFAFQWKRAGQIERKWFANGLWLCVCVFAHCDQLNPAPSKVNLPWSHDFSTVTHRQCLHLINIHLDWCRIHIEN